MKTPSIPDTEAERLEALRRYEILDSPAEQEFDDFTWLAAQVCGTPIALISLVDAHRQWFKSKTGIDAAETPRDISFCGHAILGQCVFEVPDTREDERFRDNPLVTSAPNIRFYASAPLTTPDGHNVGTLCVIDHVPHQLTPTQRDALVRLGRQVVARMEMRLTNRHQAQQAAFQLDRLEQLVEERTSAIAASEHRFRTTFDSAAVGIAHIGLDGRFLLINQQFCQIVGYSAEEFALMTFQQITHPDDIKDDMARFELLFSGAIDSYTMEKRYFHKDGTIVWVHLTGSVVRNADGEIEYAVCVVSDISERVLAQKALGESHRRHRTLLGNLHGMAYRCLDDNWTMEFVSDGCLALLGVAAEELTSGSCTYASLVHPDDLPTLRANVALALTSRQAIMTEYRLILPDGRLTWVLEKAQGIYRADGQVEAIEGFITDISQRKQIESVLHSLSIEASGLDTDAFFQLVARRAAETLGAEIGFVACIRSEQQQEAQTLALWADGSIVPNFTYPLAGTPCESVLAGGFCLYPADVQSQFPDDATLLELDVTSYAAIPLYDSTHRLLGLLGVLSRHPLGDEAQVEALLKLFAVRTAAEFERQQSEKRFADLFEFAPDAILMTNAAGRIRLVNQRAEQIFGYLRGELIGQPVEVLIPPSLRHGHVEMCKDYFASSMPRMMGTNKSNLKCMRKGGTVFPAEISLSPMGENADKMVIVAVRDISERLQVAARLAESERFASATIDALGAHIAILDENGIIISVNRAWREFALRNDTPSSHVSEGVNYLATCEHTKGAAHEEASHMAAGIRAVISGELKEFLLEYACHTPDARHWFLCRVTRFPGAGPLHVVIAHEEVTGIKQSQLAMQQALSTLNATEDAAFIFDPDTLRFSYVNEGAVRQLGYSREELLAMRPFEIRLDFNEKQFRQMLTSVPRESSRSMQFTTIHRRKDGHEIPVEINLQYVSPNGDRPSFIATSRDITERKQAQDAILALNADLEARITERTVQLEIAREAADAANRAKSAFLANMSHEIRTPLNAIAGMIELLEHTTHGDEQARMLRVTRDSANALAGIINDVLDLSKIEAGMLDIQLEPMSLHDIITSTVEVFSASASSRNLYQRIIIDENIPATVLCDPLRLRQILFNLLGNAIKFTSIGGIEVRAVLQQQAADSVVIRIEVADTGIGISQDAQVGLFQPFVQAEANTTRKFGGTGLGLAISRRLADLMGGSLTLQSEPGQGTTMILCLTLTPAETESRTEQPLYALHSLQPVQPVLTYRRLLLADDNATNRYVLNRQLNMLGYHADLAKDGHEALKMWRSGDYALLITDCHMPTMDGYELARSIRAIEAIERRQDPIPIVAYTANAMQDSLNHCLAAGMDDALIKPVGLQTLNTKLRRWLSAEHTLETTESNARDATEIPAALSPIDWAGLDEITGGDESFKREMLRAFLAEKIDEARRLSALLAAGDMTQIERLAHRMKGAAKTISAQALAAACQQIESAASRGERASVDAARQQLEWEFGRLKACIESTWT